MFDFHGRSAVITGAARGIGRAVALDFAAHGADVCLADLNAEGVGQTADACRELGARAEAVAADVSLEGDIWRLIGTAVERLGKIDILVNNAGILADRQLQAISAEDFDRMLAVHMRGTFLTCREALPHMLEAGYGRIVNISSLGARQGFYLAGPHYCGAKGGIAAFTRQLAQQLRGVDIVANCVAPGTTRTEMVASRPQEALDHAASLFPMGRLGEPGEISGAVLYLASHWARCITGESIDVNGGKMMS